MYDPLPPLRHATRELHAALDGALAVAADGASRADYIDYLLDMWGWMRTFEQPLWAAEWPTGLDAPARAGKLAWIEQDLASVGIGRGALDAMPRCTFSPDLSTPAARFGLAYVIEGSQLGTKVLGHRLAPVLDGWRPRWIEGYGEANAGLWRGFLGALRTHVDDEALGSEASAAAVAAFASLGAWCAQRRNARLGVPA
jgi:heme oxygenase